MIQGFTIIHMVFMVIALLLCILGIVAVRSKNPFDEKVKKHKLYIGTGLGITAVILILMLLNSRLMTTASHFYFGIISFGIGVLIALSGLITLKLKSANLKALSRSKHITGGFLFIVLMVITIIIGISALL